MPTNITESNFCPLPFAHTNISTDGTYQICCRHKTPQQHKLNIKEFPFTHWKNSDYVNEVTHSFLENQQHPGCSRCWDEELLGQKSYRGRIHNEYSIFKIDANHDQLTTIEVQLENLCNLTCLMCDEQSSSAILAENKKLKINAFQQTDFSWNDIAFDHLYQILKMEPKIINIRGGEPLYNKKLLGIIEKLPDYICKKSVLHITTNATVWNDKWAQAIKKFKLVRVMFSLDATKDLYEYIRYPGIWKTVETNINQIIKINNVKPLINCVVQNLNINRLSDIINLSLKQNLWLTLDQLTSPDYLSMTNLPLTLKKQAIDHLEECLSIPQLPLHLERFVRSCQQQLIQSLLIDNVSKWEECLRYLNTRDQMRNNSHKKFLIY
jgi:molybdenum cofactor biosynthesis enzyme MoaA